MGHKDLRLGQIVQNLVFYNFSLSWLLPRDGFQFILKTIYSLYFTQLHFPYLPTSVHQILAKL